jgi:4-hydroxybenzoate polyprenyltransferase
MTGVVAWGRERFPLSIVAVLLPAYLVAVCYGAALTDARLRWSGLVAFAGVWAFFLMVRVVDEHKDYERDRVEHPDRVLQRGAVTLDRLKAVGAAALLVQVAVVLATGTWLWWALTMAWALPAARDFFLGARLADRPILYPLLHLPLSGLVCVWMAQVGAGGRGLPAATAAVALLGVALAGSVDLARRRGTYAAALGPRRVAVAVALAAAVQTVALAALVLLGSGWTPAVAVLAAAAPLAAWRLEGALAVQLVVTAGALLPGGR